MRRCDTMAPQVERKLHEYLEMSFNGEEVEYSLQGLVRAVRVKCPQGKVARFGKNMASSMVSVSLISPMRITSGPDEEYSSAR